MSITTLGIDLGKSTFHAVGLDAHGHVRLRRRFRRETLLRYLANAEPMRIGMEACPGSQWLARKLRGLGHEALILPAQFVKPYVKSNKNDLRDAEAIAEAVTRPTMRFVPIKRPEQLDLQALHRVRDRQVNQRTRLICQMRAFLLENGIPLRPGAGLFKREFPGILAEDENGLSVPMRRLLAGLWDELRGLEVRIAQVTREIKALAERDEVARRLMTIPGIGPLGASALIAAVGDGKQFRRARDLSAWLGLVPRQYSTGGKTTLLGISKRGNTYVRRLFIHGARSCLMHLDRSQDRLGAWLDALSARMPTNKVVVALANKIARIAWVILTRPGATYRRVDPMLGVA
ncbi:MAG TPA: IS110 family transposase [Gammaproteobacteria bacterium]|nr:IS110 family transposase [Gammaproteobacteria bacterium]